MSNGSHAGVAPASVANTGSCPASRKSFHGTATSVTSKSRSGSGNRMVAMLLPPRRGIDDRTQRVDVSRLDDVLIDPDGERVLAILVGMTSGHRRNERARAVPSAQLARDVVARAI